MTISQLSEKAWVEKERILGRLTALASLPTALRLLSSTAEYWGVPQVSDGYQKPETPLTGWNVIPEPEA